MPGIHVRFFHAWGWTARGSCYVKLFEVLLACRWSVFGGANIPQRLALAFAAFTTFRVASKLHTSIQKFELATFKITAFLGVRVGGCLG